MDTDAGLQKMADDITSRLFGKDAVVWDMEKLGLMNGLVGFLTCFSLADFTYFVGHRVVHRYRFLYKFIHKHHHQEAASALRYVSCHMSSERFARQSRAGTLVT